MDLISKKWNIKKNSSKFRPTHTIHNFFQFSVGITSLSDDFNNVRNQVFLMLKYSLVKIGLSFIHEVTQPPSLCFILIILFFSCYFQFLMNFALLTLLLLRWSGMKCFLFSPLFRSYLIPQLLNRVLLMFYPFLLCLVQSR